jgi:hypothetical protein
LLATSSNYSYKRNTLFTTKYIIQRQANVRLACQPPANSNFLSEQISIRHQPPATSQPEVFFSQNKSASATNHQSAEQAAIGFLAGGGLGVNPMWHVLAHAPNHL